MGSHSSNQHEDLANAEAVDGYGSKGSRMNRAVGRVAWYRFGVTFGHRLGGYVAITLLLGGIGGIAMGSTAAARRTDSSFSTFLTSTSPSNLQVIPAPSSGPNYSPAMTELLSHLPHVKHVEEASIIQSVFPLGRNGLAAISDAAIRDVTPLGQRRWIRLHPGSCHGDRRTYGRSIASR